MDYKIVYFEDKNELKQSDYILKNLNTLAKIMLDAFPIKFVGDDKKYQEIDDNMELLNAIDRYDDFKISIKRSCDKNIIDEQYSKFVEQLDKMNIADRKLLLKYFNEYKRCVYDITLILYSLSKDKKKIWFFATHENNIVGYCFLNHAVFKLFDRDLTPYIILDHKEVKKNIKDDYYANNVIYNLGKDKNYKKVGSFIIDSVAAYLKSKDCAKLYLSAESVLNKVFYASIAERDYCRFIDEEKYRSDNDKLVNFYVSNGFNIIKKVYDISKCRDKNTKSVVLFNVLVKNIT